MGAWKWVKTECSAPHLSSSWVNISERSALLSSCRSSRWWTVMALDPSVPETFQTNPTYHWPRSFDGRWWRPLRPQCYTAWNGDQCVFICLSQILSDTGEEVAANEGQRIDIPDGCVLENREEIRIPPIKFTPINIHPVQGWYQGTWIWSWVTSNRIPLSS